MGSLQVESHWARQQEVESPRSGARLLLDGGGSKWVGKGMRVGGIGKSLAEMCKTCCASWERCAQGSTGREACVGVMGDRVALPVRKRMHRLGKVEVFGFMQIKNIGCGDGMGWGWSVEMCQQVLC